MSEFIAINAALGSIKTLRELVDALVSAGTGALSAVKRKLETELLQLERRILDLQTEHAKLTEDNNRLRKENADAQQWQADKLRYEIKDLAAGAFAYVVKPDARGTEPFHWLCAKCFRIGKKAILQAAGPAAGAGPERNKTIWRCPVCRSEVRVPLSVNPATIAARES